MRKTTKITKQYFLSLNEELTGKPEGFIFEASKDYSYEIYRTSYKSQSNICLSYDMNNKTVSQSGWGFIELSKEEEDNYIKPKKITFNTLKMLVKKDQLNHRIHRQFDGMIDGMIRTNSEEYCLTTIKDLDKFRTHKDYFTGFLIDNEFELNNCCYDVFFKISK